MKKSFHISFWHPSKSLFGHIIASKAFCRNKSIMLCLYWDIKQVILLPLRSTCGTGNTPTWGWTARPRSQTGETWWLISRLARTSLCSCWVRELEGSESIWLLLTLWVKALWIISMYGHQKTSPSLSSWINKK